MLKFDQVMTIFCNFVSPKILSGVWPRQNIEDSNII